MLSASDSSHSVPEYGRRLIPTIVDEIAEEQPDRVYFYVPKTNNEADGYDAMTSLRVANAVNRLAWWFDETLGKDDKDEAVGYIGPNDIRYMIIMLAAAKSGYKILYSSPRNSMDGHLSLIKATNCTRWLVPPGVNVEHILERASLVTHEFLESSTILDPTLVKNYPYKKSFEEGRHDPLVIMHTSGSTGLPKPITIRLGGFACLDANHIMDPIDGERPLPVGLEGSKILITLPPFHAGCMLFSFKTVFFYNCSTVFPPPGPVTAASVEKALDYIQPDGAFIVPSTLEELVKTPSSLEKLRQLRWITTAGGPLAKAAGNAVIARTQYHGTYGMTESYLLPILPLKDQQDWNYYQFHPQSGVDFRPHPSGLFELVFVRRKDLEYTQPVFLTFPNLQEFSSRDLWSQHPTKNNLWKYEGRGDDIIVLSNAEKFNPLSMEGELIAHPLIKSALVLGQGRFQTSLLLEPQSEAKNSKLFIDAVWPAIEKCNEKAPAHAQIQRELVMLTNPEKSMFRTPKGTVQRRATAAMYDEETDRLYRDAESTNFVGSLDLSTIESIRNGIGELVCRLLKIRQAPDHEDFFALGMDSLVVLALQRTLQSTMRGQAIISPRDIYEHPTVAQLSKYIHLLLQPDQSNGIIHAEERSREIQSAISKHFWRLPTIRFDRANVVVTGTSGSLGPYLLDSLANNPYVAKVWCLNRRANGEARQIKLADERGLDKDWGPKVIFLHSDLQLPYLGLKTTDYQDIIEKVTHVIHNSWRVDFNLALPSFESQLISVRQLLDTCYQARRRVSFQFISSIAVGAKWKANHSGPVTEATITDFSVAGMGYGESKLAAEHIIERAAKGGIIDAKITRVGQVAGPVRQGASKGKWTTHEWLPTIIDTSMKMSMLPSDLGTMNEIDWIPVDLLSHIICELAFKPLKPESDGVAFFHTINPRKTVWANLAPIVQRQLEHRLQHPVRLVSLPEWVDELRREAQKQNAESNVDMGRFVEGVKLLDFYEALASKGSGSKSMENKSLGANMVKEWSAQNPQAAFDVVETLKQSRLLQELDPVGSEWMRYWLLQWGY